MEANEINHEKLREFGAQLLPYVTPLLIIGPEKDTAEDVLNNGTGSYIDTGDKTLLVTAAHVYDGFRDQREKDDSIVFAWSPAPGCKFVNLSDIEPIAYRRDKIDLCAYTAELNKPLSDLGKAWVKSSDWPPKRVEVGDQVVGIGFPGANRRTTGDDNKDLMMVATVVSGEVSSVSDRHFVVADEDLKRMTFQFVEEAKSMEFGGMSGGVFFRFIGEDGESVRFELAGFLYESYDVHQKGDDAHSSLYVTHADFLRADGTIDEGLLPF